MPRRSTALTSAVLGSLSIGSGLALLVAPSVLGRLYAMPSHRVLLRSLGARDVVIGALLLNSKQARRGARLRALSDLSDTLLMIREARRTKRPLRQILGRVAGGLCLAFGSGALSLRQT